MQKENVIIKNKVILNRGLYRWAAPRSVFVRGLINDRIQDLQRLLWWLRNSVCGRFQIKFAMTPLCKDEALNKDDFRAPLRFGFTLIELLVVVLIIGILAAVAVPQYQKAVAKTRIVPIVTAIDAYKKGVDLWLLQNGWPTGFVSLVDLLDVDMSCDSTDEDGYCYRNDGWYQIGIDGSGNTAIIEVEQGNYNFNIQKTSSDPIWRLGGIWGDTKEKKIVCQWWASSYGTEYMQNETKTECATIGVN